MNDRAPSRILLVTGVGLRGEQEDRLVSLAGRFFDPPVPVIVHRYGVLRSGVVLRAGQRAATGRLVARLRRIVAECGEPDVFAHSFGAWLVGHALIGDPGLRVGRVVLTGSVLRPDFDWKVLISRGQVEAVLNHYGRNDQWSRVSQLFIPDSGPSGYRGFVASAGVLNQAEPHFAHTTFFRAEKMETAFRQLWGPFLNLRPGELRRLVDPAGEETWRPVPWLLRANLLRGLALFSAVAGAMSVAGLLVLLVGGLVR
ncbi:hypothetical protein Aph01nite_74440 [Acrocarpospora phusangensis]|uniref:Uncharacterized protein n=1 Tax=Acrocarpospora phusangensis TaxID=1070424 RepID=A0A919UPT1_9ACTN|nr:hypothetical protein [Acrocarpospora phusangensis]GIH29134.1 hypothetical protein Aph01nite_74440 [Acrocarpospora phusangensis]